MASNFNQDVYPNHDIFERVCSCGGVDNECDCTPQEGEPSAKRIRHVYPNDDEIFLNIQTPPVPPLVEENDVVIHEREPRLSQLRHLLQDRDFTEYETGFESRLRSYFIKGDLATDIATYINLIEGVIIDKICEQLVLEKSIKFNMFLYCLMSNISGDTLNSALKTKNVDVFRGSNINEIIHVLTKDLINEYQETMLKKSGWSIGRINGLSLRINRYEPLRGGCVNVNIPKKILNRKACISVPNKDGKCFMYAMLAKFVIGRPGRISKYSTLLDKYDFSCIHFPTSLRDIHKFEKVNNVSINIFGLDEKQNVYPLKVVKEEKQDHRELLMFEVDEKSHFVYIKNLSRLVRVQKTKHEGKIHICKRCLSHFSSDVKLMSHKLFCNENKPCKIILPKEDKAFLKFEHYERQIRVNFVIYSDFESILLPISKTDNDYNTTIPYQLHKAISFCTYLKAAPGYTNTIMTKPFLYRGSDAPEVFMNHVTQLATKILEVYKQNNDMIITPQEMSDWVSAQKCYLCNEEFTTVNYKVKDHCHISSKFRGASCNSCNLRAKSLRFIPVIIHNLSGYDSHFIVKQLGLHPGRIDVIPNSEEKYISFTKHVGGIKLQFVDSFRFMPTSLGYLASTLPKNEFKDISTHFTPDKIPLVTTKGIFCYDYIDSETRLLETSLPPKEAFYSKLIDEGISDEEYDHAKKVWSIFNCKSLGEYSDIYLKTDVLLLCDVFEYFRTTTMKSHGVDPAHYLTIPSLTWDAMLKYTKIELSLLTDYDMILLFERGIRGGLCQVSHRFAEANNTYLEHYNKDKDNSFIMYYDANNLYGGSMSSCLPYGGFEWVTNIQHINSQWITNLDNDGDIGYIFDVDLIYPTNLHNVHAYLPFLPESLTLPGGKTRKLIPHLGPRNNYVVHYRSLKQAILHGLELVKVHAAIQFKQSKWLKCYIELNTELRKKASNDFEKDFFKLLNNAVFGKTMESVRKRMQMELVVDKRRLMKLIAQPNFKDRIIYDENLAGIILNKTSLIFNKPIYIGQAVLDISKTLMYDFHYNVMVKRYGEDITLLYTDTDSFIYSIITHNVYNDMLQMSNHFDTSEYPKDHLLFSDVNKKVLGKFKDELNGAVIWKFVGLRPKMYAIKIGDYEKKRGNGIKTSSLNKLISFADYERILTERGNMTTVMRMFQSKQHTIRSVEINKVSLSYKDDKRVILADGISTLPYGHLDIPTGSQ